MRFRMQPPFLTKEGFQTYGIYHSAFAIEMAEEFMRMNESAAHIQKACATMLPFEDNFFDVCIETNTNTIHGNTTEDIEIIFNEIHRVLKTHGKIYGILVSGKSEEFGKGVPFASKTFDFTNTKTFRGQFDTFPIIHFFQKKKSSV